MANLQLAVKSEYFDAMIRGEKTEEYRLCNDYWNKRIMFREYDRLIITKGYPKRDDSSRRIDVPYDGYEVKTITHVTNGAIVLHTQRLKSDPGGNLLS
ncbi:ASCH domain-containing protein [Escherichia coli]|uniref:ASCH domain-containing protein n=1 Tax=Escherichia coli TaxID=562 RepID=UPI00203B589C|nr:ASCH domain-containing protein [Escherichia coli]MCM2821936.1 ASCH domain-containing protein [Escherichia coli]MCM2924262.1 ASCH domain-containing protein [Escherichia coli]